MSVEDRFDKLNDEQLLHLNSMKSKLEQLDSLSSNFYDFLISCLTLEDQVYADPIKKLQEETYQQLLVLREGLYQSIDLACSGSGGGVSSSSDAPVSVAAAPVSTSTSEENKALREENAKLKYRVKFLVKTLDEVEASKKK